MMETARQWLFRPRAGIAPAGWIALAIWLGFVSLVAAHHEPWRDEVRALTLSIQPAHVWQLPEGIRDEGHPVLWYLLLRGGWFLLHSAAILPILSVAIGFVSCWLLLRFSPLPLWVRILFIFGIAPLYELSVIARNYGIGMLLMFLFAVLRRRHGILLPALVLAALANTNAPAAILTPILAAVWILEAFRENRVQLRTEWKRWLVAMLIVAAGMAASLLTAWPDSPSRFNRLPRLNPGRIATAVMEHTVAPAHDFGNIFPRSSVLLAWLVILGLLPRIELAGAALAGFVSVGSFFRLIYPGYLRHQAMLLVFLVVLYWLGAEWLRDHPDDLPRTRRILRAGILGALPLLLAAQVVINPPGSGRPLTSIQFAAQDIGEPYSTSREAMRAIDEHPDLRNAILVGDPETWLEPFGVDFQHPIYLAREHRYGRASSGTTSMSMSYSLGELLETARRLRDEKNLPVVLVLGHDARELSWANQRPGHSFSWTAADLRSLRRTTRHLGNFRGSLIGENYDLYVLEAKPDTR